LIAAGLAAAKIAAPTGLAQRMWVASTLQSHAGSALVASGASRLSRRNDSWISDARMWRLHPPAALTIFFSARARPRPCNACPLDVQSRDNLNPTTPCFSRLFGCRSSSRSELTHDREQRGLAFEADAWALRQLEIAAVQLGVVGKAAKG